jgi:hypothetical protein
VYTRKTDHFAISGGWTALFIGAQTLGGFSYALSHERRHLPEIARETLTWLSG